MEHSNIMDNVPVGICVCMIRNGRPSEVTINEHMRRHLGIKTDDNYISTLNDFIVYIHPEDKAMCISEIGSFIRTGDKLDGICRILNQNIGKYNWAHVEGNLIPRSDELSIAYLSFTDITALKEIEASLRESRQMYENAVKSSRLVLWKYDIINRQLTLSHDELTHAEAVKFGFPEIIENAPDSLANYFEENDMPQVYEAYHKLEAGQDASMEVWYKKHHFVEPRCERITFTVVKDLNEQPVMAYGLGQNITAEKKVEERYKREISFLRQNSNQHMLFKCRCNLTRNIIEEYTRLSDQAFPLVKGKSYEKMWSYVPEMLPNESERQELIKLIDRENLIKCYQRGEIQHNIQYSRMSNQNTRIWVSLTINTYLVPETGDIEGFLYAYDITEKKLGEQIIAKLTALGYEELGIIHIPTHSTRIYRIGKRSNDSEFINVGTYEDGLDAHISAAVPPEMRDSAKKI